MDRTEKLWYVLLHNLWPLLQHFYFWKRDWALGSTSTEFSDFPNTSWFPKIVSLKLFSNLWGNLYTMFLYYILSTILPLKHYVRDCSPSCLYPPTRRVKLGFNYLSRIWLILNRYWELKKCFHSAFKLATWQETKIGEISVK